MPLRRPDLFLLSLLLLSGDVHPNPGPTTKFPCAVCTKNVTSRGVSYLCNRCNGWVHSKCSTLTNARQYRTNWICNSCLAPPATQPTPATQPPAPQLPPTPPSPATTPNQQPRGDDSTFNILQLNANGIGNKLAELGDFLEKNKVKIAVIQESKLSTKSKTPSIRNFTTVRRDRSTGQGGGLLAFIHSSITFTKLQLSKRTLDDSHLEELSIKIKLENTELIITNIYIPPASSCTTGYQPSLEHLMTTKDTLLLGDFNAHHSSWHSRSNDTRGRKLADEINLSDYGILNEDSPTRVPNNAEPSSPDVSLASSSLLTSSTWNTLTTLSSDHLPILIRLQMKTSSQPGRHRTYINLKKANWEGYQQEVEDILSLEPLPTDCQKQEKIFRASLLKAASHHIPSGRHRHHEEPLPASILDMMKRRDDLRSRDPTSSDLPTLNEEIQQTICKLKENKCRQFVETLDPKTDSSKLWRTIKSIDGKQPKQTDNEALTFNSGSCV